MERAAVALVKYDHTPNALRKALELCDGFEKLKPTDKVLIKPNAGQGLRKTQPPNGVVTTTVVLEDLIGLLRDCGCTDITIGEGPILLPELSLDGILPGPLSGRASNSLPKNWASLSSISMKGNLPGLSWEGQGLKSQR
jgi:hypothetical protein